MQQPGACRDSAPNTLLSHMISLILSSKPFSEMKKVSCSIFWIGFPQKISMVCPAPGGHFGICGPLPQAMLKPEAHVDVLGPTAAGVMLMSVVHVPTGGHADVSGLCCYLKPG